MTLSSKRFQRERAPRQNTQTEVVAKVVGSLSSANKHVQAAGNAALQAVASKGEGCARAVLAAGVVATPKACSPEAYLPFVAVLCAAASFHLLLIIRCL